MDLRIPDLTDVIISRPPEWVAFPFARRSTVTIITALGGTGKTNLALACALAAASGQEFLGRAAGPQLARCVYLGLDAPEYDTAYVLRRLLAGMGITPVKSAEPNSAGNFLITPTLVTAHSRDLDVLDKNAGLDEVMKKTCFVSLDNYSGKEIPTYADLLIVDSLDESHLINENDSGDARQVMKKYSDCARKYKCGVVILHHESKPSKDGRGAVQLASRGSTTWINKADNHYSVELKKSFGDDEKWIQMQAGKGRAFDLPQRINILMKWSAEEITLEQYRPPTTDEKVATFLTTTAKLGALTWNQMQDIAGLSPAILAEIRDEYFIKELAKKGPPRYRRRKGGAVK